MSPKEAGIEWQNNGISANMDDAADTQSLSNFAS
jgi:hypothetical protein